MTYSIVAVDPASGEIGVAVATRWPAVGATVPWVEPGVGGVATQSFTNVDLGPRGLALLREGNSAVDALRALVESDAGRDVRQIGLVDASGRSAAHSGSRCVAEAGHVCEPGVSVQANMSDHTGIWSTMLGAFGQSSGDLAARLLHALKAGESVGGDVRGSRSSALLVAPGEAQARPWARRFDLRIDDAPQPVEKLAWLLRMARAHEALDAAIDATETGELALALVRTTTAFELAPEDAQVAFWHGVVLAASGRHDEARPVLQAALRSEPRFGEFGRRCAEAASNARVAEALSNMREGPMR